MTRLVISLTTIPPRFPFLLENLECLLRQTAVAESINLYIPRTYRRFSYSTNDIPSLPDGVALHIIDEDLGPATKILPACKQYKDQDVFILFGDDDKVYDKNWAKRFLDAAKQHPGHAICEEGAFINSAYPESSERWESRLNPKAIFREKNFRYRLLRNLTLGRWRPSKCIESGYVDILEGWGGAMIRPDFLDEAAFDIPDILWTVDDIWISGCLERRNVPIWLNGEGKIHAKGSSNEVKKSSLRKFIYSGHDRGSANRLCIDYFRNNYRIWMGTTLHHNINNEKQEQELNEASARTDRCL
jgi:hypothetical protein